MHNMAKEMAKWAMEKAKYVGYDNISSQDWCDLAKCLETAKNAVCIDKDYRIVEAMDKEEKEPNNRGRFGYKPYLYKDEDGWMDEYLNNPYFERNARMGYRDTSMNHRMGMDTMDGDHRSRYGEAYDGYNTARRHYTETKSPEDMRKMKEKISDVFTDMENIVNDVVRDMDANEKQNYKMKLQNMMNKIM